MDDCEVFSTNNTGKEDGEISYDSDDLVEGTYVQNVRPRVQNCTSSELIDDQLVSPVVSESSDSEEDVKKLSKKQKQVDLCVVGQSHNPEFVRLAGEYHAHRKNNVWGKVFEDEELAQGLSTAGQLNDSENTRGVESYDFVSALRMRKEEEDKISDAPVNGIKDRLGTKGDNRSSRKSKRKNNAPKQRDRKAEEVSKPRTLLDLNVTEDSTDEEVAQQIAAKLYEEKDELVLRAVQVLGKAKAIELFNKTKEIEQTGGMMVENNYRRRSPGGIFFYKIKKADDIPRTQINEIFAEDKREFRKNEKTRKRKRARKCLQKLSGAVDDTADLPPLKSRIELAAEEISENEMDE